MSPIGSNVLAGASGQGGAASGYEISKGLRFNSADSASLSRPFRTEGNRKKWTWSGWIKRSSIDSHNAENAAVFADARGSIETTFGFLTST